MRHRIIPNKKRPWHQSPIIAVFLGMLIVWGIIVVTRTYLTYRETRDLRNQYQAEHESLEQKKVELSEKLTNLSTDRGLEEEVRNRYRVARPGEELVIVVDDASQPGDGTTNKKALVETQDTETFWSKIRHFIGL